MNGLPQPRPSLHAGIPGIHRHFQPGPQFAPLRRMRLRVAVVVCLALLGPGSAFAGQNLLRDAEDSNVNRRYTVDSVSFAGAPLDAEASARIPEELLLRLKALTGAPCDSTTLDALALEIRDALHLHSVSARLTKGSAPGRVRVDFETRGHDPGFDISLPRFLYHSSQHFSGEIDATARYAGNSLAFGVVSNGDDLTERYSGLAARFRSVDFAPRGLHSEVVFEDYHEQWNDATKNALGPKEPELYRSRWNVAPSFAFRPLPWLETAAGVSFERTESWSESETGDNTSAATLDVHAFRRYESGGVRHQLDARYSLRLATRALGSGYAYARHLVTLKYSARRARHTLSNSVIAGSITGNAPFFERFVLGSSSTLRGWNRYDIDPLGGSRVIHDEIAWNYRLREGSGGPLGGESVEAFYDTGALWQQDRHAMLRHSLGAGVRKGVFVVSVAVPLRSGGFEPVFMAGMNY